MEANWASGLGFGIVETAMAKLRGASRRENQPGTVRPGFRRQSIKSADRDEAMPSVFPKISNEGRALGGAAGRSEKPITASAAVFVRAIVSWYYCIFQRRAVGKTLLGFLPRFTRLDGTIFEALRLGFENGSSVL